jgi:hypothetical protein
MTLASVLTGTGIFRRFALALALTGIDAHTFDRFRTHTGCIGCGNRSRGKESGSGGGESNFAQFIHDCASPDGIKLKRKHNAYACRMHEAGDCYRRLKKFFYRSREGGVED